MLSIFSHSLIVLLFLRDVRIKAGFKQDFQRTKQRRQHLVQIEHFNLARNPKETTVQSLSHQLLNNHVKYVQRDGVRLKLSPVSLESHSSELNQSRLFDSIQIASQAEEERKRKAENESWAEQTLSNFARLLSISCLLHFPPFFFHSLYHSLILLLEAGIIGTCFMLRHSLDFFLFSVASIFLILLLLLYVLKTRLGLLNMPKQIVFSLK